MPEPFTPERSSASVFILPFPSTHRKRTTQSPPKKLAVEYLKRTKFCKPNNIITKELHSRRCPFKNLQPPRSSQTIIIISLNSHNKNASESIKGN